MVGTEPVREVDLHAYLDGELTPERAAQVDAYLRNCPDELLRLEQYRADGDAITRVFLPWKRSHRVLRARRLALQVTAIALVGLLSITGLLLQEHGMASMDALARAAAHAHVTFALSDRTSNLPLSNQTGLETAISREISAPVHLPQLSDLGFHLVAAHVLPPPKERAVQLVYSNSGHLISIYIEAQPGARETPFRLTRRGAIATVTWRDDDLACAISGEVAPSTLRLVGQRLYTALN